MYALRNSEVVTRHDDELIQMYLFGHESRKTSALISHSVNPEFGILTFSMAHECILDAH